MAAGLLEKGREGIAAATIDLDTNTIKLIALDFGATDVAVKAITGATNATPIVVTATAHGFANGDLVIVAQVGGNLAANGKWKIANVATNTFELTDPVTGANVVGSGAYTSGGYAVCCGPSAAGDNLDDFDGCRFVGTTDQTLTSVTVTNGVFDSADPTFGAVNANGTRKINAVGHFKDTGTASTSPLIYINDGRQIVTCAAQAAASATSIAVERLAAGIPSGTVLTFSNGASATLSALANAGDRTVTVTALAAIITAGSRADAPMTGAFPSADPWGLLPNGGTVNFTVPNSGLGAGGSQGGWYQL
jgi:hypothetical protein